MANSGFITHEDADKIFDIYAGMQSRTHDLEMEYIIALEHMSEDEVRRAIREAIGP